MLTKFEFVLGQQILKGNGVDLGKRGPKGRRLALTHRGVLGTGGVRGLSYAISYRHSEVCAPIPHWNFFGSIDRHNSVTKAASSFRRSGGEPWDHQYSSVRFSYLVVKRASALRTSSGTATRDCGEPARPCRSESPTSTLNGNLPICRQQFVCLSFATIAISSINKKTSPPCQSWGLRVRSRTEPTDRFNLKASPRSASDAISPPIALTALRNRSPSA